MPTDKLLQLLESSGPSLHALLTRLTLREDVAEDLMQELFIKLSTSSHIDRVDNLGAYARTVAINMAYDWRRKKMLRNEVDVDDVIEPADEQEKAPLARLIETEQLNTIVQATERLNKTQRKVFVMRYVQQCSFEQIAQETGKTQHHVRALCSRALSKVKDLCGKTLIRPTGQGGSHVV